MANWLEFLRATQNSDGGWGYKPGGMSFVEPTAAVLLALDSASQAQNSFQSESGRNYLLNLQHVDGGWGIAATDPESGWMSGWAVWALADANATAASRGTDWLINASTLHVTDPAEVARVRKVLQVDSSLQGWPWQAGDAPWVFPTALALLALQAAKHADHPRAKQGIQFLLDRAVPTGGWNIGNPFIGTGEIPATIVDTSLTLVSLGGFAISNAIVDRGLEWLAGRFANAQTATELAWGAWALQTDISLNRLSELQREDGSWLESPFTTAIAILALARRHVVD